MAQSPAHGHSVPPDCHVLQVGRGTVANAGSWGSTAAETSCLIFQDSKAVTARSCVRAAALASSQGTGTVPVPLGAGCGAATVPAPREQPGLSQATPKDTGRVPAPLPE